jgi:hypothetical protein
MNLLSSFSTYNQSSILKCCYSSIPVPHSAAPPHASPPITPSQNYATSPKQGFGQSASLSLDLGRSPHSSTASLPAHKHFYTPPSSSTVSHRTSHTAALPSRFPSIPLPSPSKSYQNSRGSVYIWCQRNGKPHSRRPDLTTEILEEPRFSGNDRTSYSAVGLIQCFDRKLDHQENSLNSHLCNLKLKPRWFRYLIASVIRNLFYMRKPAIATKSFTIYNSAMMTNFGYLPGCILEFKCAVFLHLFS